MWISNLQEKDLFYALKAASFGIQKLIEQNFKHFNQEDITSDKKIGIISTEIICIKDKKYVLIFSSLFQEALDDPLRLVGINFHDYNEQKNYIITRYEGYLNKEISIINDKKKIDYSMPLDLVCFEVRESSEVSPTLFNYLINNNKIIKKLTEHQFSNYLELIYYGLNNDKINNKNTLNPEVFNYISNTIDFKIKF